MFLSHSPSVSHELPAGDTHLPSDDSIFSFMDSKPLPSCPLLGDGPAASNAPFLPRNPASPKHKQATGQQLLHAATDGVQGLSASASQLLEPVARFGHDGTSGSLIPSDTHISPAFTGPAAFPGPFAGQPASPLAPRPGPPHALARNFPEVIRKSSWGSGDADLLDRSLKALPHHPGFAREASCTLSTLATDRQNTAVAAAATSAGLPARSGPHQSPFPMQSRGPAAGKLQAQQEPARTAVQHSKMVQNPLLHGAQPCRAKGPAVHISKHGQESNFPDARPHSPAGTCPERSHQQDLLGDWGLATAAAGDTSSALIDNVMLESLGMQDLPGFLGSAEQPPPGTKAAAWEHRTAPHRTAPHRTAPRLGPAGTSWGSWPSPHSRQPPVHVAQTSQPHVHSHPSSSQAATVDTGVHATPPEPGMPVAHKLRPPSEPSVGAPAIRPQSRALLPIRTGGRRAGGASAPHPHVADCEAVPDVFNIPSLDSFEHLQQRTAEKAFQLPTSRAGPRKHAAVDWSNLGECAPAPFAAQANPWSLHMNASDIEGFDGGDHAACAPASPTTSLRRSARLPKPLQLDAEDVGDDGVDPQSGSEAEDLKPEAAEIPNLKRSKVYIHGQCPERAHSPHLRSQQVRASDGCVTSAKTDLCRFCGHEYEAGSDLTELSSGHGNLVGPTLGKAGHLLSMHLVQG